MNRPALLLSGIAGLLLGLLGSRTAFLHRSATSLATTASAPSAANATDSLPGSGHRSDAASDRMARVFSALKELVELARRHALHEALRDLPAAEFPALLERASRVPPEMKSAFTVALMIAWFAADPAAAGEWMRAHPDQADGVETWARADPDGAIRDALAAPDRGRSKRLLFAAIEKLAGKDPAAQVAQLREMPPGGLREQVFADVLKTWANSDPRAAFAAVEGMKPGGPRDDARKQVILTWAGKDPASALAQVPALLPTLKTQLIGNPFLMSLAERVMEKDPRIGLEWIDRLPPEHRQSVAIAGLAAWAKKEPIAALEWGLANDIEVARGRRDSLNSWRQGVLGTAVVEAPAATFQMIESLPTEARRTGLVERALCYLGWLPEGEKNVSVQADFLRRMLPQLPTEAQATVAREIGSMTGMRSSFSDAGTWSQMFPAGEVRDAAVCNAFGYAVQTDPTRADRLLATLPPSSERDAALSAAVTVMSYRDPATAAQRALEIGDRQKRQKSLDAVLKQWRERDPAAVEAWTREQRR